MLRTLSQMWRSVSCVRLVTAIAAGLLVGTSTCAVDVFTPAAFAATKCVVVRDGEAVEANCPNEGGPISDTQPVDGPSSGVTPPSEDASVCRLPDDATINAAMSLFGGVELPQPEACSAETLSCPATNPLTAEGKKILLALEAAFSNAQSFGGSGSSFVSFQDPQPRQKKQEFNYYDIPYKNGRPDMDVVWELLHKAYGLPYIKGKVHPTLTYYMYCNFYSWGGWFNNNCKHMSAVVVAGLQARGVYCGQNSVPAHVCAMFYSKPPEGERCSGWWVIDWYGKLRPAGPGDKLTLLNGQMVPHPVWGISPKAPKLVLCPGYGMDDKPKNPQEGKPGGSVQPKVPPAPTKRPRR